MQSQQINESQFILDIYGSYMNEVIYMQIPLNRIYFYLTNPTNSCIQTLKGLGIFNIFTKNIKLVYKV